MYFRNGRLAESATEAEVGNQTAAEEAGLASACLAEVVQSRTEGRNLGAPEEQSLSLREARLRTLRTCHVRTDR